MSITKVGSSYNFIYNTKTGKLSTKDGSKNEFVDFCNGDVKGEDTETLNHFDEHTRYQFTRMLFAYGTGMTGQNPFANDEKVEITADIDSATHTSFYVNGQKAFTAITGMSYLPSEIQTFGTVQQPFKTRGYKPYDPSTNSITIGVGSRFNLGNGYSMTVQEDFVWGEGYGNGSPAEVAENCQVIITMLPNSPQVREVCLGENGIASAAKEGTIVIDMSSIDPVQSKEIGAELNKKGIDLMDAPVSGGEPKAIDGTISVMVGGSKENFDKYYDLLMAMAGSVVYVGELGSGNVAKLANQVIVALNIAAVSEALTLAVKNDADPELVYKAIRGGLAGSTVLDAKAPMMMAHNFKPGFRIELHIKDLNNALNAGHAVNAALPLTSQVMEIMQSLKADGNEKDDHSAIVKYYEKISDTSVEKKN